MNFFNNKKNLLYVTIISLLIFIIAVSYKLYTNYRNSEIWEHSNEIPIAELDPELIYLDSDSQQKVKEYMYLENQIWDVKTGNFKSNKNFDKLMGYFETAYDSLSDLKHYAKNYDKIMRLYPIKQSYDRLVNDNKINYDVSEIKNLLSDNNWKIINEELSSNEPNQFAKDLYNNLLKIGKDSAIISEILNKFQDVYQINNKEITVKENKTFSDLSGIKELESKLTFNWEKITNPIQEVINKSSDALSDNQKRKDEIDNLEKQLENYKNMQQVLEKLKNSIDLRNFVGKSLEDFEKWTSQNNIKTEIVREDVMDESQNNQILNQYPNKTDYDRILKNSKIKVFVGKYAPIKNLDKDTVDSRNKKEDSHNNISSLNDFSNSNNSNNSNNTNKIDQDSREKNNKSNTNTSE